MQPMQVDQFGLTTDGITSLLEGALTCESVREEGMAIYVKAVKR